MVSLRNIATIIKVNGRIVRKKILLPNSLCNNYNLLFKCHIIDILHDFLKMFNKFIDKILIIIKLLDIKQTRYKLELITILFDILRLNIGYSCINYFERKDWKHFIYLVMYAILVSIKLLSPDVINHISFCSKIF